MLPGRVTFRFKEYQPVAEPYWEVPPFPLLVF
ncbi:hypothetical protein LEWO105114_01385 [Legionella worsleiensis]|nr:Uncharacterised protein [Legionella worsleiensis]